MGYQRTFRGCCNRGDQTRLGGTSRSGSSSTPNWCGLCTLACPTNCRRMVKCVPHKCTIHHMFMLSTGPTHIAVTNPDASAVAKNAKQPMTTPASSILGFRACDKTPPPDHIYLLTTMCCMFSRRSCTQLIPSEKHLHTSLFPAFHRMGPEHSGEELHESHRDLSAVVTAQTQFSLL